MGGTQIPYPSPIESQPTLVSSIPLVASELVAEAILSQSSAVTNVVADAPSQPGAPHNRDALLFLLPLLIVLSTFLFLILLFLVFVILLRRRRGIRLRDGEGPIDLSREDFIEGEGGLDGVETRWLESVSEPERRTYLRAKGTFISISQPSPYCRYFHPTELPSSQIISFNTRPTPSQPTSPSPNSSQSKRRGWLLGHSNPTWKPCILCLFTPGPK